MPSASITPRATAASGRTPRSADVTSEREPNGMCIIISKKVWLEIGGCANGLHYLDRLVWASVKLMGRRIYLIEGVYMYHWHRADGAPIQKGEWVISHQLPNGRVWGIKDPSKLPKYDGVTYF